MASGGQPFRSGSDSYDATMRNRHYQGSQNPPTENAAVSNSPRVQQQRDWSDRLPDPDDVFTIRPQQQNELAQQQQQQQQTTYSTTEPAGSSPTEDSTFKKLSSRQMNAHLDAIDLLNMEDHRELESGWALPEIVVIGDQSDGKTTLLGAISGVQLPSGDGLSTLCPIRLSLRAATGSNAEYSINGKQLEQVSDFKGEVANAMKNNSAGDECISADAIEVRVTDVGTPNLSLVDLPGINRKTKDYEEKTENIIKSYISRERAINVVVAKASNDIEASKGLQLARNVDPDGDRTVLVFTHCDGPVKEESVSKVLKQSKAKVCFANCVLKTTGEATNREARFAAEDAFFREHQFEMFKKLPPQQRGTRALIETLENILVEKICPVRHRIFKSLLTMKKDTSDWLTTVKSEDESLFGKVDKLMHETRSEFADMVIGRQASGENALYSSCRQAWNKFREEIKTLSREMLDNLPELIDRKTEKRGEDLKLLPRNFPALQSFIDELVDRFQQATQKMFKETQQVVGQHLDSVIDRKLKNYKKLLDKVKVGAKEELKKCEAVAKERVMEILDMHTVVFDDPDQEEELIKKLESTTPMEERPTTPMEERPTTPMEERPSTERDAAAAQGPGDASIVRHQKRCFHELHESTSHWISVACDQIVIDIPKAMIKFVHRELAKNITGLIRMPRESDLKELMSDPGAVQRAEDRLKRCEEVLDRLSSG